MVTTREHTDPHSAHHIRIRPPKKWVPIDIHELLNYRELLLSFTWRDIKIRYKQTALGFLWAFIQPLFLPRG